MNRNGWSPARDQEAKKAGAGGSSGAAGAGASGMPNIPNITIAPSPPAKKNVSEVTHRRHTPSPIPHTSLVYGMSKGAVLA
jgi:hypothetical protein